MRGALGVAVCNEIHKLAKKAGQSKEKAGGNSDLLPRAGKYTG
jgi:hypothetical protein